MSSKNYIEIKSVLPWRHNFMYVDTEDYLADQLFIYEKVRIKFKSEYGKNESKYIFIFASCKARDWLRVKKALSKLSIRMFIFGYRDYESVSSSMISKIDKGDSKEEK